MAGRRFDHLDLRVRDLEAADAFYARFLPEVGFPIRRDEPGHALQLEARSDHPRPEFVALIEDPAHTPNAGRIAFWAESRAAVDRIGAILGKPGLKTSKAPCLARNTAPSTTPCFSKTRAATAWRFAAGRLKTELQLRLQAYRLD